MQTEKPTYSDISHSIEEYCFLIWQDMLRHYFGWSAEEAMSWLSSQGLLNLRVANLDFEFHDEPQDQLFGVIMRDVLGDNADHVDYATVKWAIKNEVDYSYDFMNRPINYMGLPLDFDWPAYLQKVVAVITRFKDTPSK